MSEQTLYIMTGLPYAGKSTLTKELVQRFGFKIASVDEVLEEKDYDIEKMTQEDWNYAYSEAYRRLKEYLTTGISVILDIGNLKKSERETARSIAKNLNIKHRLIYVNTTPEQIRERWLKNQETKERGRLEDVSLKRALDMFEPPTPDENPVIYNQQINLEEWINQNIK